jgi:uncharacterized membrane protein YhdT
MNLLSTFGGGLFVVPLLFIIGIVVWMIAAIRSSKSGTKQQTPAGTVYTDKKTPFTKTWPFLFACILIVILIGVIYWMVQER